MKIKEICSRMLAVVEPHTDLRTAARLMREHHVGSLIVVEKTDGDMRPVGIITDRDIVIAVLAAEDVRPEIVTAGDVMGGELAFVREDDGMFEAIEAMSDKGARRMPVVDAKGRLVGIVTLDDLLRVLASELSGLAAAMDNAGGREVHERPAIEAG